MSTDGAFDIGFRLAEEAHNAFLRGDVEQGDEKLEQAKEIMDKYFLTGTITSDSMDELI